MYSRNKHHCARMDIALLIPQPDVRRSALNQQDLILPQVAVLLYERPGRKLLGTENEMLRTIIFSD
jgi:hypothetical protein